MHAYAALCSGSCVYVLACTPINLLPTAHLQLLPQTCKFIEEVLLSDFPVEVVFQYPAITKNLLAVAATLTDARVAKEGGEACLQCLSTITRALRSRLRQAADEEFGFRLHLESLPQVFELCQQIAVGVCPILVQHGGHATQALIVLRNVWELLKTSMDADSANQKDSTPKGDETVSHSLPPSKYHSFYRPRLYLFPPILPIFRSALF
jgi:hypothetical protein